MFSYASALVEMGYLEEVFLSFLIVGHTHCNLDQNFSVLSKKIHNSQFIGSPIAMRALYNTAHEKDEDRPLYNIHLEYVHDYKKQFANIITKKLKFFQVNYLNYSYFKYAMLNFRMIIVL
jgi:hypothetical protein